MSYADDAVVRDVVSEVRRGDLRNGLHVLLVILLIITVCSLFGKEIYVILSDFIISIQGANFTDVDCMLLSTVSGKHIGLCCTSIALFPVTIDALQLVTFKCSAHCDHLSPTGHSIQGLFTCI